MHLFIHFFSFLSSFYLTSDTFSATLTQEKLYKGKVTKTHIELYIDLKRSRIIKVINAPQKAIMTTNTLGEMEIYYPESNTLIRKQKDIYSADNEVLFYLLKYKDYNLGISKAGATKTDTEMDEGTLVTKWAPPQATKHLVKEVKLVFKNNVPIYTSYTQPSGEKQKETFYYKYKKVNGLPVPTKITEYLYTNTEERVTSRTTYSNITPTTGTESIYQFEVPKNAELITEKELL